MRFFPVGRRVVFYVFLEANVRKTKVVSKGGNLFRLFYMICKILDRLFLYHIFIFSSGSARGAARKRCRYPHTGDACHAVSIPAVVVHHFTSS